MSNFDISYIACLKLLLLDPTKYFGIELGAQTQIDKKNERFIVNGSHDSEKLQDILDGYIKKFVLCQQCENPETKLQVSKEDIFQVKIGRQFIKIISHKKF